MANIIKGENCMAKVTGIGGVFLRVGTRTFYVTNLSQIVISCLSGSVK